MIQDVLRPQYPATNHTGFTVSIALKDCRSGSTRVEARWHAPGGRSASAPTWIVDFVRDPIARPSAISRRNKCLTVAGDFNHECMDIAEDSGIGGAYVIRLLDWTATFRGYPKEVRTDKCPEFTCSALITWTQKHGIKHILIESVSPTQSAYIENFNDTFGGDTLCGNRFEKL
jgi:putative transposase